MATNVELRRSNGTNFNEKINVSTHWSLIEGKPTTFTPTAHPHSATEVSETLDKMFISSTEKTKLVNLPSITSSDVTKWNAKVSGTNITGIKVFSSESSFNSEIKQSDILYILTE